MALKAVLFDMDDTLIDWSQFGMDWPRFEQPFLQRVYRFVEERTSTQGDFSAFEAHFRDRTRYAWENGRATHIAPNLGHILGETARTLTGQDFVIEELLTAYEWSAPPGVSTFPDVPPFLDTLQSNGILTGIITNAFQPMWLRDIELAQYDLLQYFPAYRYSAADIGYLKPHPTIFQTVLAQLGIGADEAVFVGDNPTADIIGAQRVGMKAILRNVEKTGLFLELITPDAIVDTFAEIPAILDTWFSDWQA